MHVGWTRDGTGVLLGVDGRGDGPTSVRGEMIDHDEVQLAGDGELVHRSPYLAYRPEDTRIISYRLLHHAEVPAVDVRRGAHTAPSAKEARRQVIKNFGKILEENAAGDNLFFRVLRRQPDAEAQADYLHSSSC